MATVSGDGFVYAITNAGASESVKAVKIHYVTPFARCAHFLEAGRSRVNDIFDPTFFVSSGCEYTQQQGCDARTAPAHLWNLLHHAVEMFLKEG